MAISARMGVAVQDLDDTGAGVAAEVEREEAAGNALALAPEHVCRRAAYVNVDGTRQLIVAERGRTG